MRLASLGAVLFIAGAAITAIRTTREMKMFTDRASEITNLFEKSLQKRRRNSSFDTLDDNDNDNVSVTGSVQSFASNHSLSVASTPEVENIDKRELCIIGLIGCGQVGCLILETFLSWGWPPSSLMVASRDQLKVAKVRNMTPIWTVPEQHHVPIFRF